MRSAATQLEASSSEPRTSPSIIHTSSRITAHDIAVRQQRGDASTEDLRVAMVHYRALFEDLLETDDHEPREAHR